MNELLEQVDNPFHNLIVRSFAQSRIVDDQIRAAVLPALNPITRVGAERLLRAIASRRIFDVETLIEIEVLIERIEALIAAETDVVECWDNDPHNVSGSASWTELRQSENAENLRRAERALLNLQMRISAVLDFQNARAAAV